MIGVPHLELSMGIYRFDLRFSVLTYDILDQGSADLPSAETLLAPKEDSVD
jgi:hypothetical protein